MNTRQINTREGEDKSEKEEGKEGGKGSRREDNAIMSCKN
jgi:hypothetical protein